MTAQIKSLLTTRDLRFYGIAEQAWSQYDSSLLQAEVVAPDSHNDKLASHFLLALDYMDEMSKGEMLAKLKRCPNRRKDQGE